MSIAASAGKPKAHALMSMATLLATVSARRQVRRPSEGFPFRLTRVLVALRMPLVLRTGPTAHIPTDGLPRSVAVSCRLAQANQRCVDAVKNAPAFTAEE